MASTTQSALVYVKNARSHLLGKLKNLSVILENLRQKEVFSDEAVSKIQAEKDDYDKTRKILDRVKCMGEKACYEFLRIVDMTRQRTLEADLHHWISCFPFREDAQMDTNYLQGPKPCHRYQAKLKLKARKTSNEFWTANKKMFEENNKPDVSYMSLVLDTQGSLSASKIKKLKSKKSKMIRPKKLRTYVPEDKVGTSPGDLLKTYRDVLVVGKPGIGKTAVTQEILRLWADRDNEKLDYMFYFDMRETSHIRKAVSLEDLLFNVFSEPDEGKEEVLQDIKNNSDNVTLIFDGITDLSSSVVKKLVDKELLPDAKIIMTCRPDDEEEFSSEDFLRVEVKGFSEPTIKAYLSVMLGEEQQKKVFSNMELFTLCHVPMHALMVAACFSFETPEDPQQPCTITVIYISIVRFCLQRNSNNLKTKHLNPFIKNKRKEILSLAEAAFNATEGKTVNLTELPCEDSCVLSFLKPLFTKVGPMKTKTTHAFLHYTMQEFFAALWLLKNPDKIKDVFQQCLTEERKHMKHLVPFMCCLLNEKSPSLTKCLIPAEELKNTSDWFFKEMITTFFPCVCEADSEDDGLDVDILFLCQCLYESQCPEACIQFLDKLDYRLDLSGESLDALPCCAVAYVVTQSEERKVSLNLEDVRVSDQGMRRLFGCLKNVQWCDPLPLQLWRIFLLSEGQMDHLSLLGLDGNQLHLPVEGKRCLFEQAVKVMQKMSVKVNVCLHWDRETRVCQDLCESLFEALSYISSVRVTCRGPGLQDQKQRHGTLERKEKQLLLDLCLTAARRTGESFHNVVNTLLSLFSVRTDMHNILLDFYQHVKTGGFLSVIPLRPVFQSAPAVWSVDLSERKTSILLEVLKLQSEKKQVELRGWSGEESEVRSFLQCVPYISQLSFVPQSSEPSEEIRFFVNLFCAAAEREQQTGEKILELLSSLCSYQTLPLKYKWCDFLLDLYTHETGKCLSVLPSLQSVFQSAPAVWSVDLSERKTSILLEVLKLQSEKKQVELRGWSDEESEVRSFLQCVPYISQLWFSNWFGVSAQAKFFGNLFCAAAKSDQQTREKILDQISSLSSYQTLLHRNDSCGFLLDLCSHLKDYETQTGLSVLPSLQSVFQSAPAVWSVDLSERKTSILLEVLKLQSEKKQVELRGWSDEESEVRSFLQCVPYISQLSFCLQGPDSGAVKFCGNLFCAAAEREQQTGEKILELLSSLCSYQRFPLNDDDEYQSGFLLDLCSHLKDCETQTGLSVLPSLQSVFQSAPAVWSVDLSERKTSILLEVLKLQSEKKQVELRGWSDEESEVRSFLQCVPYISQLSFCLQGPDSGAVKFCGNLFCAAAEREQQTGEKILELLSSLCSYQRFPLNDDDEYQSGFLLDLCSHLKDCETQTGLSVLPSLQSVFQSAPAVWSVDLSERKTSILLEVLKLQSEKKQVELRGWSDEESEVRSFLQCVPYISQLSFCLQGPDSGAVKFCGNLFCAAAEREQQTGEKILELLSSLCSYQRFPLNDDDDDDDDDEYQSGFLLDLYSHLKDYETQTGLSVLPSLQSVFQSAPAVWSVDLSERKTSILLEVLKLQSEKKQVKLRGWSDEESEVRSFLQCVPYISQLSFYLRGRDSGAVKVCVNLFCAAAEREQQTGEKILELLSSLCSYQRFPLNNDDKKYQSDFLLDLCSHLKDYETQTGLSVLPSLQSVFQSAPAVWSVDLSERKTSILLEVLKLQSEKKQVELRGWSDEESEVRSFLQCVPYISQLSLYHWWGDSRAVKVCVNLFCAAAEREQQTGEKILELLSSLCSYQRFPLSDWFGDDDEYQSGFLLDLYSHLKDCETQTGLSVLPSVQSVFQSAPAVWSVDLSERKTSILLEVLKLQSEKKQVELRGWSDEESEVRSFLQCVPYISQLSFYLRGPDSGAVKFCVNLFCAAAEREQQTGEKILELLSSLCSYQKYQSGFLLDLCSHLKDYETQTGLSVLPSLQSVFQSAPAVWSVDLSERKTSILLEVLKLQSEKKQVELRGWSDEESEVRSFLQCVPYISQLSLYHWWGDSRAVKVCVNLFCAAAEREQQTGEKILELLSSLCSYQRFPLNDDDEKYQSGFLLDLCSHLKDCETQTGLSVLPSVQSVFQSAPAVWSVDLSETKTSILLEVLKLQSEKKQVELRGWSDEESEVRSFLQCVPYISQLSCGPEFFQSVCTSVSVRSRQEAEQLASLLQLLGFTLLLTGELHLKTCRTVGRVLVLCGSEVNLTLTPQKISVRGASVLFRRTTRLHSLRLSNAMALLLCRWVRRGRVDCLLTVQELSLSPQKVKPSERVLLRVVSSLASLLRYWTVRRLDLTELCAPAQGLIPLLLHDGPLTVKLSEEIFQQLLLLLHEIQDEDLTRLFLAKAGGDLTSCRLTWELLHYLLQQPSSHTFTVNLRKNSFLEKSVTRLLPFLHKIVFKRLSPSFVLAAIREIYDARASPILPSLLRSFDHVINLSCREMDSVDCAALRFTLRHSVRVKLNLLWSSIPAGETESILFTLDRVSQLSVDRKLLLRLVRRCAASDVQQGAAAVELLRTVQHRLDLSCSSCVELDQTETLSLTADDCWAVSAILRHSSQDTQVILQDCQVEDSGLDLLFPVLHTVRLRASKAVLLQLVSLVPVNSEWDAARRAASLCGALGGELDLSHSTLDQRACGALALMLDWCEELTELDLSHCRLTDQLLLTLSAHLHKVQVLDLSHNNITDASTGTLLQLVSTNPSIHTVRLFGNKIVDRTRFDKHKFEMW